MAARGQSKSRTAGPKDEPVTGRSWDAIRRDYNAFVARHEIAWELAMAALAIAYVALGYALDVAAGELGLWLRFAELTITAIFVVEFATRFAAAWDRRAYLRGHWIDLIALTPEIREIRVLRLLRFLRLLRAAAALYRVMGVPIIRRIGWHLARVATHLDARAAMVPAVLLLVTVGGSAAAVTLLEGPASLQQFGEAVYWAVTTLMGSGDSGFVSSVGGRLVSGMLIAFSVTVLAVLTGLVIGFIVDVVLKEGQGMGFAGLYNHVVVCGWNATAREVVEELRADASDQKVVVLAELEANPAGGMAHFVRGDPANAADLERAGIRDASAAIVFPSQASDDADMRSILIVMTIKDIAPHVRAVVEAANPKNLEHLRRAHADEVIAAPLLVSHLLARSSVHAGLVDLVMDLVTGGEGSEIYRIELPDEIVGMSVGEAAPALRANHRATLLAVARGETHVVNPPGDFVVEEGDELLVIAESIGELRHAQRAAH